MNFSVQAYLFEKFDKKLSITFSAIPLTDKQTKETSLVEVIVDSHCMDWTAMPFTVKVVPAITAFSAQLVNQYQLCCKGKDWEWFFTDGMKKKISA